MFLSKNEVIGAIRGYCEEQFKDCSVEELKFLYRIREDLCVRIKKIETRESNELIEALNRLEKRYENFEEAYNPSSPMALNEKTGAWNGHHECACQRR